MFKDNQQINDDREIIDRLGGSTKVAELIHYKVQRVQNWKERGIPSAEKLKFPHLFLNTNIHTQRKAKANFESISA